MCSLELREKGNTPQDEQSVASLDFKAVNNAEGNSSGMPGGVLENGALQNSLNDQSQEQFGQFASTAGFSSSHQSSITIGTMLSPQDTCKYSAS